MDEATLQRLADHGLLGHSPDTSDGLTPDELPDLASWCTSQGENTGSAAFVVFGTAMALIAEPWEEEEQGIPGPFARELDAPIRHHLPGILSEPDSDAQLSLARSFREDVTLVLGKWDGWRTSWLHSPSDESS